MTRGPLVVREDHRAVLDGDPHPGVARRGRRSPATPSWRPPSCLPGSWTVGADEGVDHRHLHHGGARLITFIRWSFTVCSVLRVGMERVGVVAQAGDRPCPAGQVVDDLVGLRVGEAVDVDVARRRRSDGLAPSTCRPGAHLEHRRTRWRRPSRPPPSSGVSRERCGEQSQLHRRSSLSLDFDPASARRRLEPRPR